MNKIIINADDFGKSKETNFAIMTAMDLNLCRDSTLLVNFKDSVHAAELAHKFDRTHFIGVHLNLTSGFPLTDKIKKEKRFCDENGMFYYNRGKRLFYLTYSEKKAVELELINQIRLGRSFGLPISHADSHHHIHEEPALLNLIIKILLNEKIPFLRLAKNIGNSSTFKSYYRNYCNWKIQKNKLLGSNYFGSTQDYLGSKMQYAENSIIELMIHPGKTKNGEIYDHYLEKDISIDLSEILKKNELISYSQLL